MEILITGILAGIALAIPLGPMAILLITTTSKYGRGIGIFGALAMASVDFSYAALVFTFGSAIVESLNDWVWPMRIGGSAILVFVAVKIFIDARKSSRIENPNLDTPTTTPLKTYAKFFGLTVLNPATAFYFVGITPSVALIDNSPNSAGVVLFAIGVFIGSVVWQMSLVFAAQLTSKFTDEKIQHRIQYLGSILIFGLALGLLLK